jgi:hypothetical protein
MRTPVTRYEITLRSFGQKTKSGRRRPWKIPAGRGDGIPRGNLCALVQDESTLPGEGADAFRISGEYLGRVDFPEPIATRHPAPLATTDHIWTVVRDEFQVPYVVRYRIERPGEDLP